VAEQPCSGLHRLVEVSMWHINAPHTVGSLWTRDRTSTWQCTTQTRGRHACPRRESNPQTQQASGHWDRHFVYWLIVTVRNEHKEGKRWHRQWENIGFGEPCAQMGCEWSFDLVPGTNVSGEPAAPYTPKMEATGSSRTLVSINQTTRLNITKDFNDDH